jgi:hypothetical protein
MKSPMLGRKATMFLAAMFAVTLVISIVGLANVRPGAWKYVIRYQQEWTFVLTAWIYPPLALGFALLLNPFARYFYKLRAVPEDHRRWGGRVISVAAVLCVGVQLLRTASVFAYWYREAHPLAAHPAAGSFLGLPDPDHLIGRGVMAAGGVMLAWAGNGMAKLLPSPLDRPERYDRGKAYRLNGWVMVLFGVAAVLCAFLLTYPIPAAVGVLLSETAMVAVMLVVWLYLRSGDHPARTAPDGEAS